MDGTVEDEKIKFLVDITLNEQIQKIDKAPL